MRSARATIPYPINAPEDVSDRRYTTSGLVRPSLASLLIAADRPWMKQRVPNGFWSIRENRVEYFDWLGQQCGFSRPEHWYAVRKHHFQMHGGGGLFHNDYRSSALAAMRDYMPEYDWKPWLFGGAPNGFWKVRENRCLYMDWLAERLEIREPEDWYCVTGADFFNNHGGGLLNNHFKSSVQAILADYLPDYPWMPWRFTSVPQSFWRSRAHRKDYLYWLGDQLGFRSHTDWSQLKREHFFRFGGAGLFVSYYHGSIRQAVSELFAE